MIYLNRKSIELINKLKEAYPGRVAQTNSRKNGSYGVVRVYKNQVDKGNPKLAIYQFDSVGQIKNHLYGYSILKELVLELSRLSSQAIQIRKTEQDIFIIRYEDDDRDIQGDFDFCKMYLENAIDGWKKIMEDRIIQGVSLIGIMAEYGEILLTKVADRYNFKNLEDDKSEKILTFILIDLEALEKFGRFIILVSQFPNFRVARYMDRKHLAKMADIFLATQKTRIANLNSWMPEDALKNSCFLDRENSQN